MPVPGTGHWWISSLFKSKWPFVQSQRCVKFYQIDEHFQTCRYHQVLCHDHQMSCIYFHDMNQKIYFQCAALLKHIDGFHRKDDDSGISYLYRNDDILSINISMIVTILNQCGREKLPLCNQEFGFLFGLQEFSILC